MTDSEHPKLQTGASAPARRVVLKSLVWAAPAIVATASIRARAAAVSGDVEGPPCPPNF